MRALAWAISLSSLLLMPLTIASAEAYRNVEFAHPGGVVLRLDASVPEGAGPFPAAILVHGGGWVRGDRRIDVAPLFKPLADAGIAWFTIDYRLTSDPLKFGDAVGDVEAAVRFVREHAEEYHVDPDRIALIGESAGGHLAAMAALDEGVPPVQAVVALYAPTNLVALAKNSDLIPDGIRDELKGTVFEKLLLAGLSQLSPIEKVHPGMPPFLLIHGTADPIVPVGQSRAMCAKIQSVGGRLRAVSRPRRRTWNPALGIVAFPECAL